MANLPKIEGDSIYADKDGIQVYTEPNASADKQRNGDNGGVVSYSKGDFIGTYTGKILNGFYELDFIVRYKFGLFKWGVKNRSFTGYLLPTQITTTSQQSIDDAQKAADDAAFQANLDKIVGGDGDSNLEKTASGNTTETPKSNTMIYIFGGLALLLGGVWLYMTRKKKTDVAKMAVLPVNQPIKK